MNKRIGCSLGVLLVVGLAQGAAVANEAREAKAHQDRGHRMYNLGNFEEAIKEFSKAYEIEPAPVLLYDIAASHRAAGNWDRAIFFYHRFLVESPPDAKSRDKATQYMHELEEKVAAEKEAKKPPSSSAPIAPASSPPSAPGATAPPVAPVVAVEKAEPRTAEPVPVAPKPETSTRRALAWVAGGAAVAALAVGVVFQLKASGSLSDFNAGCRLDDPSTNRPISISDRTNEQCASLYDDWHSGNRWALAGYLTGAAFAATSAVLFIVSRPAANETRSAHAHVDCGFGLTTLACGGVF